VFLRGGNAFTANSILGLTDNFTLTLQTGNSSIIFKTNGSNIGAWDSTGNFVVGGTTSTAKSRVLGAANGTNELIRWDSSTTNRLLLLENGTGTVTGTWTFSDINISNQAAAATEQRTIFIDSTGKLQKTGFIKHDETNKKITFTGKDTTGSTVARFEASDNSALFEVYTDFTARFFGGVAFMTVPNTITSGNAGIETQDITGIQFRVKDLSSNDFWTVEKLVTTNKRLTRFKKAIILDTGIGMERYDDQIAFVTSTTAAAQNVALKYYNTYRFSTYIKVSNVMAYATNGNLVGMKDIVVTAKNVAGTVTTGVVTVTSDPVPNTITGTFNININGTAIELRFQNDTGTGRTYTVFADYSYAIIPLPL
jgi:hypothetical protein